VKKRLHIVVVHRSSPQPPIPPFFSITIPEQLKNQPN